MLPTRVTARVAVDASGCWLWTGATQRNGYGYTRWKKAGKWGHARVHRLYYEDAIGPIPDGLEIDHLCKVRHCVNPMHLRAVTHVENCENVSRWPADKMNCPKGHPLEMGPRSRYCRTCRNAASLAWYYRKREGH